MVKKNKFINTQTQKIFGFKYYSRKGRACFVINQFREFLECKTLDVGNGGSELSILLNECLSIDINPVYHPDVIVDLEQKSLPFITNAFTCSVSTDVLEHLESVHTVILEMIRVSSKYLILSLPNNWLSVRSLVTRGSYDQHLRYYGLPIKKPEDRHRWFFSFTEAEDFFLGLAKSFGFRIIVCEPYFGIRNQIKALLLRPFLSSRRINNLFASEIWVVLDISSTDHLK